MSEIIKVKILPDGITAKEVNAFGGPPQQYNYEIGFTAPLGETSKYIEWKLAQEKLRVFKITGIRPEWRKEDEIFTTYRYHGTRSYQVDQEYQAEILDNNKLTIRLL